MKRLLLALVIALAGALILGNWLLEDPGYVRILRGPWEIETSLAFVALVLVFLALALVVLTLLASSLRGLIAPPFPEASWARRRGRQRFRRGVHALLAGRPRRARRLLAAAGRSGDWALPPLLGAALAAQLEADPGERDALLAELEREPDGPLAAGLMRALLALFDEQPEQAREELERLREHHRDNAPVVQLLARACRQAGDWETLAGVLPELQRLDGRTPGDDGAVRAWQARLRQAAQDGDAALHRCWKRDVPASLHRDPRLVATRARELARLGEGKQALRIVEQALRRAWDPRLPLALEAIEEIPAEQLLERLEQWLARHPRDTALLCCAGRIALRARLWGKARAFFESAARDDDSVALAELARLQQALGDEAGARHSLERRLRVLGEQLPALPLPSGPDRAPGPPS